MKKLTVEIRHSDGRREEISVADAILLYERRRDAAVSEVERLHCQRRIEELQARWKKALRSTSRAATKTRVRPSERPTRRRAAVSPDDDTR